MGEFGDYFRCCEWEYCCEKFKIDEWKKVLECVFGKIGFILDEKRYIVLFVGF